jgi:predicted PurR-regulated permease PerM
LVKSLETGQNFWVILAMTLAVFAIVQLIQDSILTPKIMGDATGMSPVIILLSLSVWGKILGMLGLLLAIPLTNLILTYYNTFISRSGQLEGGRKLPGKIDIKEPVAQRVIPV